jgi:D-sedoheptulose 7-phosphate isomerase
MINRNKKFINTYFKGISKISEIIDKKSILKLVEEIKKLKDRKGRIFFLGVVGRNDDFIAKNADNVVVIPNINPSLVTPYSEAYQAVVWHALVSHPLLQSNKTKW